MFRFYLLLILTASAIGAKKCKQNKECSENGGTCMPWDGVPNYKLAIMKGRKPIKCGKTCICYKECEEGVLLIAGGRDTRDYHYINSSEIYGFPTCSVPDLPVSIDAFNLVFYDNNILACGGTGPSGQNWGCYKLMAGLGWVVHSKLNSHRIGSSTAILDGNLYILGGTSSSQGNSVILTPGSSDWVPGPNIPGSGLDRGCVVVLPGDEGFLAIGGGDSNKHEVKQYNGSHWHFWSNLTLDRYGHACELIDKDIIVAGGIVKNIVGARATTVIINIATKQYRSGPNMASSRAFFVFNNVNGKLFAVGGQKYGAILESGEIFDPVLGGTIDKNMTVKRARPAAGVVPKQALASIIGCP